MPKFEIKPVPNQNPDLRILARALLGLVEYREQEGDRHRPTAAKNIRPARER